jgi:hypothetical protein
VVSEETEWLGCGVATHDPECLCDVVIRNPLPPLEECIFDGVGSIKMGERICEIQGYGIPWSRNQMLDYFTDLMNFTDRWATEKHWVKSDDYECLDNVPSFGDDLLGTFQQWELVRDTVQMCMDKFDEPLAYILEHLCLSPDVFITAATCRPELGAWWDSGTIELLEHAMMYCNANYADISRQFSIPEGVTEGLRKYFYNRRIKKYGSDTPVKDMMHSLALTTTLTPSQIRDAILEQYGIEYSISAISKYRKRNAS